MGMGTNAAVMEKNLRRTPCVCAGLCEDTLESEQVEEQDEDAQQDTHSSFLDSVDFLSDELASLQLDEEDDDEHQQEESSSFLQEARREPRKKKSRKGKKGKKPGKGAKNQKCQEKVQEGGASGLSASGPAVSTAEAMTEGA